VQLSGYVYEEMLLLLRRELGEVTPFSESFEVVISQGTQWRAIRATRAST
jgi:hypothetical protein